METSKMEFPNFVKLNAVTKIGEGNDEYLVYKARINPFHISSYNESADAKVNDVVYKTTRVVVGGERYYVTMSVSEFDEMMDKIERNIHINME